MHEEIDRAQIENGRENRDQDDLDIRHIGIFRHQERPRTHQRRCDLSAGRGGSLDPAGFLGFVAQLLHQRDRECPRCHDIGDGRARDRPHARRSNDRGFRRTARLAPRRGKGQVDEELACARHLEKGAEQDEHEDIGGRHAQRQAEDPLLTQVELPNQTVDAGPAMRQDAGHPIPQPRQRPARSGQGIGDGDHADDGHAQTHDAAAGLEHGDGGDDPHHDVGLRPPACPFDDVIEEIEDVEPAEKGRSQEHGINKPADRAARAR